MAELAGGFSKDDIAAGFEALRTAGSPKQLRESIESMPVLRAPIFHAQLRQYRLKMEQQAAEYAEHFANFLSIYDAFFTQLHYRAFFSESNVPVVTPDSQKAATFGPPFYMALSDTMGNRLPPLEGPAYDPATESDAIEQELKNHLNDNISLPPWRATNGSRWAAAIVACPGCRLPRLAIRAQLIDLTRAPELLEPIQHKRINNDSCPRCGAERATPVRIWIQEQPAPADPLAAISWICRARPTEATYLPPAGTKRNPDYDRILEIRMEMLLRQLADESMSGTATGVHTNGIAYSIDELLWRLESIRSRDEATVAYEDIVQNITERLRSGVMPLYQTEQFVQQAIVPNAKQWPIVIAPPAGDLIAALVRNLIARACAEARGAPPEILAAMAGAVIQCYTGLGELGLAETSLARAEDLLRKSSDTARQEIGLQLENVKAELLTAQGRHQEAETIRQRVMTSGAFASGSLESRLAHQSVAMNHALYARRNGRLAEALTGLLDCLQKFSELEAEAREKNPEELSGVRHSLSGAIANLGMAYRDAANNLELMECLGARRMKYGDLSPSMRRHMHSIGSAEAFMAMQSEMLERVEPLLDRLFPDGHDSSMLIAHARHMLENALSISKEIGGYDFAAVQSHSLAQLLSDVGESEASEAIMRESLAYAARITDYSHMAAASLSLAQSVLARGAGAGALQHLRECLRLNMRESVRQGAESQPGLSLYLASEALRSVAFGGDPLDAILAAESAKAIPTAISVSRGVPLQATATIGNASLNSLLHRRESLRLKAIWSGDDPHQQIEALEQEIETARREMSRRDERFALWHDATFLEVSEARSIRRILLQCGERATFAGFIVERDSIYCYAIWNDGQIVQQRALPDTLVKLIAENRIDPELYRQPALAQALSQVLIDPLRERLKVMTPDDRLILSVCEPFTHVPFALIPFNDMPLCRHVTLSITFGIGVLEASAERSSLPLREAVCLGAPARPDVPDLPHAREEVGHIVRLLESAHINVRPDLTGTAATVNGLFRRTGVADLLHFACHAVARPNGESQLLLAPDLMARDSGVLSDDRIISSLVLKQGCHVNLAGCQTGVGEGSTQFYQRGLIPAFLIAGAGSVIGSLWKLEDSPAARFQTAYYQRLIAGMQAAASLAQTQRDCVTGQLGEDMKDPSRWAAYLIYGIG